MAEKIRLCDEIHFVCDGVFGMVKRRFSEDMLDEESSGKGSGGKGNTLKRSKSRRARKNPKCVDANSLVEILEGEPDLDDVVKIEVLETGEKVLIPSDFVKVKKTSIAIVQQICRTLF